MKKHLFLFAAAAVALASCSSDDTIAENSAAFDSNQQKEIAFTAFNQKATRTAADVTGAVEGTTFPTDLEMTVGAYDVTNRREFFASPVEFAYNYAGGSSSGASGKWGGKTAQYWPLSATQINFLAIANANVDPTFNAISDGTKTVTIAQTDNYAYTAQNDLMYARGTGEVTFASNTLTIPDDVPMTFLHAQSYLVFRLRAADAATAGAITIKDIKVKDAYYSGTATVTHTNWNSFSSQDVSVSWTGHTKHSNGGTDAYNNSVNTNNQTAWTSGSQALTQNYVELGHTIVLPHATAFSTFTIEYWLDGKDYSFEYTPASTTLAAGTKYIYDVTFKLHEIFVVPTVTDWVDVGQFVGIPSSLAIGTDGAFGTISKKAATYTFAITGTNGTVTVATTGTETAFAETPTVAAGVVTFKVNANTTGSARNYTLVVTDDKGTGDTSDDVESTITFSQAGE